MMTKAVHWGVAQLRPGAVLQSRYQLIRPLGRGASATTFLARDLVFDKTLALKLLRSPPLLLSFRQEFVRLSGVTHPHLARVHDLGADLCDGDRRVFYTADHIDGQTLSTFARGRPWAEVVGPIANALQALGFLHSIGIRHGDFKPDNILVDRRARGVLIDLGCSRLLGADPEPEVSGTLGFVAPELLQGERGDARSDLFAAGVTLRQILPALSGPALLAARRLVERLTREEPSRRPADVAEVLEALGNREPAGFATSAQPPKLIGRANVLHQLQQALDSLVEAKPGPRCILLAGPTGAGKSRLLQELKWMAQLRCAVAEGSVREPSPVASLLRRAAGLAPVRADLLSVLEERERLAGSSEPLVLVFDDIDLLDDDDRVLIDGLVRLSRSSDALMLVFAGGVVSSSRETGEIISLGPLGQDEVAEWIRPVLSKSSLPQVMRLTQGWPALLWELCSRVAEGDLREDGLSQCAGLEGGGDPRSIARLDARLHRLAGPERRVLGILAVLGRHMSAREQMQYEIDLRTVAELERQGFLQPDSGGWSLVATAQPSRLLAALGSDLVRAVSEEALRQTQTTLTGLSEDDPRRATLMARVAEHLHRAGRVPEAQQFLLDNRASARLSPHAWRHALDRVASDGASIPLQLLRAAVLRDSGAGDRALAILARALRTRPAREQHFELRREAGTCYLKLGALTRARKQLDRALELAPDDESRAEATVQLARVLVQQGSFDEVLPLCLQAMGWTQETGRVAALHENAGVAASYLGEGGTAVKHLGRALELQLASGSPRGQVRVLSYQAIHAFREGNLGKATRGYRRALGIAERFGLTDQVTSAALNLGTACHAQGDWGNALRSYERGLRMAVALGKITTTATLRWNLAKLYADIGSLDRAEEALPSLEAGARDARVPVLATLVDSLRAEISLARQDFTKAFEEFRRSRDSFASQATPRETSEAELQLAETSLLAGEYDDARARLEATESSVEVLQAEDLRAMHAAVRGRLHLAEAEPEEALTVLEQASTLARDASRLPLEAEVEEHLADACRRTNALTLATQHRSRARALWERIAASLPPHLRDVFWKHPKRIQSAQPEPSAQDATHSIESTAPRLRRLVEINRRLSESLDMKEALSATMDAAIELTGAERGFLILTSEPNQTEAMQVVTARNLDREQIGKSHLKFSRSIAEEVISRNAPILTVDALADDRFRANESVHAMKLRSVLCVPIRVRERVLGALYLDNRFQQGRFRLEDRELLMAFADQAAIALRNAQLHEELAHKTRELQAKQKKIEALMRDQAQEIDRLSEEVRIRQDALVHRFDYANIVGRSKPMQQVLSKVDRVVDSTLPVLIQGSSGTGKELVARAIHYNGPRGRAPFITVNCAALGESLLESELFGHVRGAFTGAVRDNDGLFVAARAGTLFLDEVGDMPPAMQVKLLRVLQEREVRPVGSSQVVPVDVRVLCATNQVLWTEVEEGRFREDLYYRLAVVEITLPPLNERADDIPELASHLLDRIAKAQGRTAPRVTPRAVRKLITYGWPGNVRQLENVLSKALVLATGDQITVADLDLAAPLAVARAAPSRGAFQANESTRMVRALNAHGWNVSEAARSLGVPRTTFYRKLKKYGLDRNDGEP